MAEEGEPCRLRKEALFFENSKRDKYGINSPFHSLKHAARFPAKSSLPARNMMDECMGVGNEHIQRVNDRCLES